MPVTQFEKIEDFYNFLKNHLIRCNFSITEDETYGEENAKYLIITLNLSKYGYKNYLFFKFINNKIEFWACDYILFYNEGVNKRKVQIDGEYKIGEIDFNSHIKNKNIYYNIETNKEVAIATESISLFILSPITFEGYNCLVAGINGLKFIMYSPINCQLIMTKGKNYVSEVYLAINHCAICKLNYIISSNYSLGDVIKANNKYYVTVGSGLAIIGDGSEGDIKECIFIEFFRLEPVNKPTKPLEYLELWLMNPVSKPHQSLVFYEQWTMHPEPKPTQLLIIFGAEIRYTDEQLDEIVSERIKHEPYKYPKTIKEVQEKSKRIITKIIIK